MCIAMASMMVRRESSGCGCCALVSCSVPSAILYMYIVMYNAMYRAEVGVCVYTNPINWLFVWLLCECKGNKMGVVIVPWASPV